MTRQLACPDAASWQAFLAETLPPDEQADHCTHLESCLHCQEKLERLNDGSTAWLTAAAAPEPLSREDALRQAMGRLKDQDPWKEGDVSPESEPETPLHFLRPSERPGSLGRIGRYEVVELIGRGGMGIVFKADDPELNRVVAVKVLAPQLATSGTAQQRFLREARAAAAVAHEHVITLHEVGIADGLPYLVMQYVVGQSLQEKLNKSGALSLKEILRIGLQAASGLAAAHAQGLIHRDVKPANILLENGVERVKITDFSLALAADDARLTQSGCVAGTPEYMAPEQARGEAVDHRADLFSLGSVLYAMCTGKPPFRGSTALSVLRRVCDELPPPVRDSNPEVPGWLAEIVAKLHAKDPADRIQSAAEVAQRLEQCLAHLQQPNTVPLPPPLTRPRPAARRRWPLAAAAVLLIVGFALSEATGYSRVLLAAASVLRLRTAEGTLVIQTDDPEVKVRIEGEGVEKDVIITGAGLAEVRLRPGSYRVKAVKDGTQVSEDVVSIERDGKAVVTVRFEAHAQAQPVVATPAEEVYERMLQSAVLIFAQRGNVVSQGTGTLVDKENRLVLTNHHVVGDGDSTIRVFFPEYQANKQPIIAKRHYLNKFQTGVGTPGWIVAKYPKKNLALIKLTGVPADALALPISRTSVKPGQRVHSIGNPGLSDALWVYTSGTVRQVYRKRHIFRKGDDIHEIDAQVVETQSPINDGDSGGPLVNDQRELVAVTDGGLVRNLQSFFIDVTEVRDAINSYYKGLGLRKTVGDDPNAAQSGTGLVPGPARAKGPDTAPPGPGPAASPGLLMTLQGHAGPVHSVAFLSEGTQLVSGSGWPDGDRTLRRWDLLTGRELNRLATQNQVLAVAVTPDGKSVVAGCDGGEVLMVDLATMKELRRFAGHDGAVHAVAVSPDGRFVLSGGQDGMIRSWDLVNGKERFRINGAHGRVLTIAFAPDGKTFFAGTTDGSLRQWDAATGKGEFLRIDNAGSTEWDWMVAISPDGRFALTSGPNVRLWDLGTGKVVRWFVSQGGQATAGFGDETARPVHTDHAVAFSPDGKQLLSAGKDGVVRLWEVASGRKFANFKGHQNWVWSVAFSPDGKRAVSAGGGAKEGERYGAGKDFAIREWRLTPDRPPTVPMPPVIRTPKEEPDGLKK